MKIGDRVRVVRTAWHGEIGFVEKPPDDIGYVTVMLIGRISRTISPSQIWRF